MQFSTLNPRGRGLAPWMVAWFAWLLATPFLAAQAEKKDPAPDAPARAKALAEIKAQHQPAFTKAQTDAGARKDLAKTLFQQAAQANTNPATRFVLLAQGAELAAQAGDLDLALQGLEDVCVTFQFDPGDLKEKVLKEAGANVKGVDNFKALVDTALRELGDALDQDQYERAGRLGQVAEDAAKKTKNLPLVLLVQRERQGVVAARDHYAKIKPFADRLIKDPTDEEANREVGQYLCLNKGDWERGLFQLAQGNDPTLRLLAQRDLIRPETPKEQREIGDRWWDLAAQQDGQVRIYVKQRAVHWYEQAVQTADEATRVRLEERIAAVPTARRTTIPWDYSGPPGLIRNLGNQNGTVYGVAFSPDGKTILAGTGNNQGVVWDARTGKQLFNLQGHFGMIWSVAFDVRGKHMFTSSWDGSIKMWNARTGQEVSTFPRGGRLADMNGVAISPDGKYLMSGGGDMMVHIWDVKTGANKQQLRGHKGVVYGVAFSPDGRQALSGGGGDQLMILWDLKSGQIVHQFFVPGSVRNVAFTPDGRRAAGAGEAMVRLWDLKTGKEVRRFSGHTGSVFALAFSADGRRLVTAGSDRTIRYWDVATGRELHKLSGHTSTIFALALSPGGGRVVTGAADNTVRLWGLPRR